MRGERLLNYRPALLLAAGAMLGVLVSSLFSNNIAVFILAALILIVSAVLIFKRKKAAIFFIAFLMCFLSFFTVNTLNSSEEKYIDLNFSARVSESGEGYAILENITANGDKIKGRAYVKTLFDVPVGIKINAKGDLTKNALDISNSYSVWLYKNNFKYAGEIFIISSTEKSFLMPDEWVRFKTKSALNAGIGENLSSIASALLFGDKNGLNDDIYTAVKASGLAHIFAVSGLHIGFLIAVLGFCLSKTRKNIAFPLTLIILVFYAYLSGFSPSVTRAVLMAFFMLLAALIGAPKDILSALSLTVFFILVFNPVFLFEVGFLMSVASVLGIILIYPLLYKFLSKFMKGKFLNGIAKTLAVSFSANIALLPIMAKYFGSMSLYFPLSNLLALPIATIAFIYLVVLMPCLLVFPSLAPLGFPAGLMLIGVREIAFLVAALPYAVLPLTMSVGIGFVWSAGYILCSDYINIAKKNKYAALGIIWAAAGIVSLILIL